MAIDLQNMYVQKAHRLSLYRVSDSVTNIFAGQLFQLDENNEWEYADGTKKAYPVFNNRFPGSGIGQQGERLEGRDDVSRTGKITCLKGNYEIGTDQFDNTKTFVNGEPIVAGPNGKAIPYVEATHKTWKIVGFVTQVPTAEYPMLRYEG